MAKDLTSAQRRDLMVTQADLTALSQHPAWAALEKEVERHRAAIERIVLARALHSRTPLRPEEQGYYNGFIAGMKWFLSVPNGAESRLERFLRKHAPPTNEEEDADAA